nr:hypothetical protein [Tanacetum cinerariifolium]
AAVPRLAGHPLHLRRHGRNPRPGARPTASAHERREPAADGCRWPLPVSNDAAHSGLPHGAGRGPARLRAAQ